MSKTQTNSKLEFLEDPAALAGSLGKAELFFEKNQKLVLGLLGGIVLIVAGFIGYRYWIDSQDQEAQTAMFPSVYEWEADSLKKALNGNGANEGLLTIADENSATPAGNISNFRSGFALLKLGKYDDAIDRLKKFSSSDLLVQARAYALIGDAYMEKKSYSDAIDYYKKAADYKPNAQFTPGYLMKLAVAYEQSKQNQEAIDTYGSIIDKYPTSSEAANAKKYKSVLESTVGES
ncbi:tetratricopeptide repeat protein [Larkinella rosea]|uniref:Cytochrome C biosynthesis protein n=1 Tax=Larkinella rosea TaxID=2025312 RepID=A0A3P1BT79_9BACT|nr:tetratricopeptide repeat protein [Larkinella rosea]RRB03744.1 cytochrome C biosynthesis protein [Larkinella rosea]